MKMKKRLQALMVVLIIFSATSCRLGEFFSEADPETQEEIKREESIPQNESPENNLEKTDN